MGVREPGEEAGAVEVGIRPDLEIDPGCRARRAPAGRRSGRRRAPSPGTPSRRSRPARGPARRPSRSPGRPRRPREYQRGRREARDRQVAVEQRFGVLRLGGDLAEEESPPAPILLGRDVALHHVDQLVVHQRVHALAGGERLERVGQRRDVEDERAARRGEGVRVAVVGEVLQQDGRRLGRHPAEHPALPRERVGERAHRVRHEVAQGIVVDRA